MEICALGYLGLQTGRLDEWSAYTTDLLGMQQVERTAGNLRFRMDDRQQRLMIAAGDREGLHFIGWEVRDSAALERLAARLDQAGVAVKRGDRALAEERRVADLVIFHDPLGNRLEAFHGAEIADDPFVPGRPLSGFKTGARGMGHVVLNVSDVSPILGFYRDLLGFRVTDFGHEPYKLYFFHINQRHHSFAVVGSGKDSFHHFMVELLNLDDVGQGYDLAQLEEGRVAYTLGRHTNDHMTSYYSHNPSGFFVEYGWGAREIDPATWVAHETFDGPSLWGHERLYLPDEPRAVLRDMRLHAAARGVRAPDPSDRLWSS